MAPDPMMYDTSSVEKIDGTIEVIERRSSDAGGVAGIGEGLARKW
jgi:hypothetical protein